MSKLVRCSIRSIRVKTVSVVLGVFLLGTAYGIVLHWLWIQL